MIPPRIIIDYIILSPFTHNWRMPYSKEYRVTGVLLEELRDKVPSVEEFKTELV